MKKFTFTLLEVFIGFTLAALVMGLIFSSLYQETVLKKKLAVGEKEIMVRAFVQQRLDHLLANIAAQEKKNSLYLTPDNVLHIHFDNGIEPDAAFCGIVEGELSLKKENLILKIKGKDEERYEILKESVSQLSYEFLTHDQKKVTTTPTWDEKSGTLPCYLKMSIDDVEYVFWINGEQEPFPIGEKK